MTASLKGSLKRRCPGAHTGAERVLTAPSQSKIKDFCQLSQGESQEAKGGIGVENRKNKQPIAFFWKIAAFVRPMQIPLHGAFTSFFLVLSVFPMLVLLFSLLSYTSLGAEEVMAVVEPVLPVALLPLARELLAGAYENSSGTVLSLSALAALWSAGRGTRGLLLGINAVYGIRERRGYFVTRLLGAVYTFLFLLILLLTLTLHVFSAAFLDYLRMTTNPWLMGLMGLVDLRLVLLLLLQTVLFTTMYALLPNRRNRFADSFPGAVVAALGWTVFSWLFSLYVEYFPRYSNLFGSVYALALAMLWLYFCICILFYGGALNRWLKGR